MLKDVCSSHKQLPEQFTDIPYKANTHVHHTNSYHSSLLMLHIGWYVCSSHEGLPEQFTDTPYKVSMYVHHTKSYHGSLLTLLTCENILMDREERLRRRRDIFKLLERHQDIQIRQVHVADTYLLIHSPSQLFF